MKDLVSKKAIEKTFKKRKTEIPMERPTALAPEFATTNETRWKNFIKKMDLEKYEVDGFVNILDKIWIFLEYPLQTSNDKSKPNRRWFPRKGWK